MRRTRASPRRFAAAPAAKASRKTPDADGQEESEVDLVVVPVRVELLAQQQRDEADERQRPRQHPGGDDERAAAAPPVAEGESARR